MKKYLSLFCLITVTIVLISGCDSSSDSSGSSGSIKDEAVKLPDFPADAEVTEMEELEINGQSVGGTEDTALEDTDSESSYISVTLPNSLSRAAESTIKNVYLWVNGTTTEISFTVTEKGTVTGAQVALKNGNNYFLIYAVTQSGNKYRTPILKIRKVSDDGNSANDTPVGKWKAKSQTYTDHEGVTQTIYYPLSSGTNEYKFTITIYYEITDTIFRFYTYQKTEGTAVDTSETLEYCPDDDFNYYISDGTLYEENETSGVKVSIQGDTMTFQPMDDSSYTMVRDDSLDFSNAVINCYK